MTKIAIILMTEPILIAISFCKKLKKQRARSIGQDSKNYAPYGYLGLFLFSPLLFDWQFWATRLLQVMSKRVCHPGRVSLLLPHYPERCLRHDRRAAPSPWKGLSAHVGPARCLRHDRRAAPSPRRGLSALPRYPERFLRNDKAYITP